MYRNKDQYLFEFMEQGLMHTEEGQVPATFYRNKYYDNRMEAMSQKDFQQQFKKQKKTNKKEVLKLAEEVLKDRSKWSEFLNKYQLYTGMSSDELARQVLDSYSFSVIGGLKGRYTPSNGYLKYYVPKMMEYIA